MKNTNGCVISHNNKTITLTKAYAKKANTLGTKEFKELANLHKAYPDYDIVMRTATVSDSKEKHEGLTIELMEKIIARQPNSEALKSEYNEFVAFWGKEVEDKYDRVMLERRCYVPNRVRSKNDSIFYHLDELHTAIANDWQITFRYFYYNQKKEKVFYKKTYSASPYAMLWSDNNYYLLAYEKGEMKHFRVDKMEQIKIVPQKREGKEAFRKLDITARPLRMFNMYSGEIKKVKIRFSNHLANVVIDRFGQDIVMVPDDEKHFTIHTDIEVSPQFYGWLCGLGRGVRILAPAEVVEEMGKYVKGIAEMY